MATPPSTRSTAVSTSARASGTGGSSVRTASSTAVGDAADGPVPSGSRVVAVVPSSAPDGSANGPPVTSPLRVRSHQAV